MQKSIFERALEAHRIREEKLVVQRQIETDALNEQRRKAGNESTNIAIGYAQKLFGVADLKEAVECAEARFAHPQATTVFSVELMIEGRRFICTFQENSAGTVPLRLDLVHLNGKHLVQIKSFEQLGAQLAKEAQKRKEELS